MTTKRNTTRETTDATKRQAWQNIEDRRQEVVAWVELIGLDPYAIPRYGALTATRDNNEWSVTVTEYQFDPNGKRILNNTQTSCTLTPPRTIRTNITPPGADGPEWNANLYIDRPTQTLGHCPRCGYPEGIDQPDVTCRGCGQPIYPNQPSRTSHALGRLPELVHVTCPDPE